MSGNNYGKPHSQAHQSNRSPELSQINKMTVMLSADREATRAETPAVAPKLKASMMTRAPHLAFETRFYNLDRRSSVFLMWEIVPRPLVRSSPGFLPPGSGVPSWYPCLSKSSTSGSSATRLAATASRAQRSTLLSHFSGTSFIFRG